MTNPFLEAIYFQFTYECKGKTIDLTDEKTLNEHGKYFVVICNKCCNVPVFHLLEEKNNQRLGIGEPKRL